MVDRFDAVFYGNSESECFDFICAVRQHAKENGKTEDDVWIANEVYNAFRGQALKWYLRLPKDVRRDWERLQEALLTRWTTDDEAGHVSASASSLAILPNAAAAPAAPPSILTPSSAPPQDHWARKVGRVRVRANGIAGARYISKDCIKGSDARSGSFGATPNVALALRVRLMATAANFYRLEIVEHDSRLSFLAAFTYRTDDWNSTKCWGVFVGVDAPGQGPLKDRRTTSTGPDSCKTGQFSTERWQLESTGRLKLCGPTDIAGVAHFSLGISNDKKDILWFNSPKVSLDSSEVDTDLEFEALES